MKMILGAVLLAFMLSVLPICQNLVLRTQDLNDGKSFFFRSLSERQKIAEEFSNGNEFAGFTVRPILNGPPPAQLAGLIVSRYNNAVFELTHRRDAKPTAAELRSALDCANRTLLALEDCEMSVNERIERLNEVREIANLILKETERMGVNTKGVNPADLMYAYFLCDNVEIALSRARNKDDCTE